MMMKKRQSRRRVLKNSMLVIAGFVGLGPAMFSSRLRAEDLPKVSEDDPTAKSLKYTHDATTSSDRPGDDQFCHNCVYYKGTAEEEWARCDLFPGKLVAGAGWCNVWTLKG